MGLKFHRITLKWKYIETAKSLSYFKKTKTKNPKTVLIVIEGIIATYSLQRKVILMVIKKTRNKECSQSNKNDKHLMPKIDLRS